jgi:hypothetical protein
LRIRHAAAPSGLMGRAGKSDYGCWLNRKNKWDLFVMDVEYGELVTPTSLQAVLKLVVDWR